ncbi:MAG TPA: 4-(cytidine 5'-diphospho)-2-C-methyl-D-erythritol kinase [Bryobacteraceae bacterium]|jgi:4-diphosphocytidyl-2-C-methyl-D-erythritol kinase|nr:4-(cytidine 5'-diphospho)-2-C-methyl-D-erythritol kinase [Bryobacteraceae bacterium]
MSTTRRVALRALAKLNLDLRVLGKRPDGYHELRTVFQTISLADRIGMAFTPGRKTIVDLDDSHDIPDNLVTRAAHLAIDAMKVSGRVEMHLAKRIPMGAGLGGGSSDAAAVLLALPVLAGRTIEVARLSELAQQLGSDVGFFLLGGTAAGIGRGTELFPLPDGGAQRALVVAPGVHVSTPQAYRDLSPRLTSESQQNKIFSFQSQVWGRGVEPPRNDFEEVVLPQHPSLAAIKKRLLRAGASAALMTGSGSALFGLYSDRNRISVALQSLGAYKAFPVTFVTRSRYRHMWWRALEEHITGRTWPPQSRYAR